VISQLYSRNEALAHLAEESDSDNESDSSNDSDEPLATLNFLRTNSDRYDKTKPLNQDRSSIDALLDEYSDIFATDYSEIPEIKFQDHRIAL